MTTTWVIAADASRARIFQMTGSGRQLEEIDDLLNPEGRLADRDIEADAKGRDSGKGERMMGHTAEPHVQAVEHDVELFSKQVGRYLYHARHEHRFDKLYLIAPPKFLGLMRQNLVDEVRKAVEDEIPKEMTGLAGHQIAEYLREHRH